jgi:hypothetical protein
MLPFFSLPRKRFRYSVDQQVDRVLFGDKPALGSMEEILLAQLAEVKAAEIYGNPFFVATEPFEEEEFSESAPLRLRSGEDLACEEQANEILVTSRRLEGKDADRREWLTTEQILLRQHKEVYNQNGFPDSSLVSGMYKRIHNPNAGNRPGRSSKSEDQ